MDRAGEAREVFRAAYEDNYDYIRRYLIIKTGSRQEMEDLLQGVFLSFYHKLVKDGPGSVRDPRHYLLKCAKAALARKHRSAREEVSLEDQPGDIPDDRALSELDRDDSFTAEEIMGAVREMDEVTYRIFLLHFEYGYTLKKTARLLGLREPTVKSRLYRALAKLKEKYGEGESE